MPGLSSGASSFQAFPSHPRAFILTSADNGPNKILQPRRGGAGVRSNCFSAGTGGQHRRPTSCSSRCVSICRLKSVPVLQTIWLGRVEKRVAETERAVPHRPPEQTSKL